MDKLLKQRVEILAQEVDKMKSGGAGEGYTKAEADAKFLSKDDASTALAEKQDSLDQTQLAAVNSGIDSTKVAQIETNKTNILFGLNRVGKNILPIDIKTLKARNINGTWNGNSYTIQGVTFTLNDDCTISVSGTNTSSTVNAILTLATRFDSLPKIPAGKYTLSGCPSGGGADTYHLNAYQGKTTAPQANYTDNGNGVTGEFDYSLAASNVPNIAIIIRVNYAITGTIVFSPMLRNASIEDGTYEHYALSNTDLTVLETEDRAALAEVVDSGAKNRLTDLTIDDSLARGLTFTLNSDGTISATGNNDGTGNSLVTIRSFTASEVHSIAGMVLSGVPTNAFDAYIAIQRATAPYTDVAKIKANESAVIADIDSACNMYFVISSGSQNVNITIRPMICTEADWKVSQAYQPYRPSYQELYEMVLALQTTRTATTRKTTKTKTNEE